MPKFRGEETISSITTKQASDQQEGKITVGAEQEGYKLQAVASGPLGSSDTFFYRGAISYKDLDGYLDNPYLNRPADPYQDTSARLTLSWLVSDSLQADLRLYQSELETTGFRFNIVSDVNDTSLPIRVNNEGINNRELFNTTLKLEWTDTNGGTFTSITAYDTLEEITTGDAFDFLPIAESFLVTVFNVPDQNQSQYYDIESTSQEFRYVSPSDQSVRWLAGAYAIATDRFVSTGNMVDTGQGVFPVYRQPRGDTPFDFANDPINPQATFLADSQDNFAWAVFGDVTVDVNEKTEASFSLRYDKDRRENTTETPNAYFAGELQSVSFTGEVRKETWDEWQPKFTLRYSPQDHYSYYGSLSRGFRSGGFNQAGVEGGGVPGVESLFDSEVADTLELGFKGKFMDGRLSTTASIFRTESEGPYYFVFLFTSSTQNLGSLDEVEYLGAELAIDALVTENLSLNLALGYTDSEIKKDAEIPTSVGNQAPLVSEYTVNLGFDYRRSLSGSGGLEGFIRADYQIIGDTYWDPDNTTVRDPINLLDLRMGLDSPDDWTVTLWAKNLTDEEYNAEFSPGGFVYKALPRRWGVNFVKHF